MIKNNQKSELGKNRKTPLIEVKLYPWYNFKKEMMAHLKILVQNIWKSKPFEKNWQKM